MKKLLVSIIVLILIFFMYACNNTQLPDDNNKQSPSENNQQTTNEETCKHIWDDGIEVESGTDAYLKDAYLMEYTCTICGEKDQQIITIIPPNNDILYVSSYPQDFEYNGKHYHLVQGDGLKTTATQKEVGGLLGYIIREEDISAFTQEYPNVDYVINNSIYDYYEGNRVAFYSLKAYPDLSIICMRQLGDYVLFQAEGNQPTHSNDLSQPITKLEFWIAENVDDVDFSKYQIKYGMMGGTEYYGTGYVPTVDEYGQQVDPEHCVIYTVTSYPDYANKEQHITHIYITDPKIEFYGITLNSSFEDFEYYIQNQGFTITHSNENSRTAKKGKYSVTITKEWIRIRVEVENKDGIIF